MMLVIAIADLLFGLERFLRQGKSEFLLIGADSSFSVLFQRTKKGLIAIRCGTTLVDEVDAAPLCRAALSFAESFLSDPGNQFPDGDAARGDLLMAIEKFARFRP
ncbi:hypothetical protein [Hyalangium versicolor]|uniref:hypothetical protein n=1 Tax=Hyalangium versicolor TaxID=2861190 RepID=UPI001CCAD1C8|nr:hypothetical protein [Hyalangium versicolor]